MTPESQPTTHPDKLAPVIGIWLMIVTADNKLFAVRNLVPKYTSQKMPGQINSPAETFEKIRDQGKVLPNGVSRTIEEEVGQLEFNPKAIHSLGTIRFKGLDRSVVALPYLIEIEHEESLKYQPKNDGELESDCPQWINLKDFNPHKSMEVSGNIVPLYRTPMAEIITMVKSHLSGNTNYQRSVEIEAQLDTSLYRRLETKTSSNTLPSAK